MSKYQKYFETGIKNVFEGYHYDEKTKVLKRVDETAIKAAHESISQAILEMSRDIWTQLDAAEDSLREVSDEIRFEELNTDPSSLSMTTGGSATSDEADVDPAVAGQQMAPEVPAFESISDLLGADDFDFEGIFENMDHLDNKEADMPFDENLGGRMREMPGDSPPTAGGMGYDPRNSGISSMVKAGAGEEEYPVGGEDEYSDLEMGMDDGNGDMGMDNGNGDEMGMDNGNGDMGMDDYDNGDEMGMDNGNGNGDDMGFEEPGDDLGGFDFSLDLDDDELSLDGEEAEEGYGHYEGYGEGEGRSYRMEAKGDDDDDDGKPDFLKKKGDKKKDKDDDDKDKDDDDDKDKDDDDDGKPDFLKKKDDD
jgi:hypothetical protein